MKKARKVTAAERLYLLRKSEPVSPPAPATTPEPAPPPELKLARADVEAILRRERSVTPEEIDFLLEHAQDAPISLSTYEEAELRNLATRLLSDRHRGTRRFDTEEFEVKTLGVIRLPYGDLTRDEIDRLDAIRIQASKNIERCTNHRRERCQCWQDARTALFEIRRNVGEKSPLGIAALACWVAVEQLARLPQKQEPVEPPRMMSPQAQLDATGRASNPFCWQYYTPTYPGFKS